MLRPFIFFGIVFLWVLALMAGCDSGKIQVSVCLSDSDCAAGQSCVKGQCVGDDDDDDDVFNPGDDDDDATDGDTTDDDDDTTTDGDTSDGDAADDDDDTTDDDDDTTDDDDDTTDDDDDTPANGCEENGGACSLDIPCPSGTHLSVNSLGCDTTPNPYCCLPNQPDCERNGGQCVEMGSACPDNWTSLSTQAGCEGICCMPDPTQTCEDNGGTCLQPAPTGECPDNNTGIQGECDQGTICCVEEESACVTQGGYCQQMGFPPRCEQDGYDPSQNSLGCGNYEMCCLPADTQCQSNGDCGEPSCRDMQGNSCVQSTPTCEDGECTNDEQFYQNAQCYDDGTCHQSALCGPEDETWVECDGQTVQECWCTEEGQLECDPNPCGEEQIDCIGDLAGICASTWFGTSCPDGYERREDATCNQDSTQCCVHTQGTEDNSCEQQGGYCIQPWGWECRENYDSTDSSNGCPELGFGQSYECCLPD